MLRQRVSRAVHSPVLSRGCHSSRAMLTAMTTDSADLEALFLELTTETEMAA